MSHKIHLELDTDQLDNGEGMITKDDIDYDPFANFCGRVYKLYHAEDKSKFYIGSTGRTLEERLEEHKKLAKKQSKRKLYLFMNEKNNTGFMIELLAEKICATNRDLKALESEFINKENPPLNMIDSILNEEIAKKSRARAQKKYLEKNIGRYRCEVCDYSCATKSYLKQHERGKKHLMRVEKNRNLVKEQMEEQVEGAV